MRGLASPLSGHMAQNLFIIGATGKVGRALVSQIYEKGDTDPAKNENPTRIVGVASSTAFLYERDGLQKRRVIDFSSRKTQGEGYREPAALLDLLSDSSERVTFVDVTASPEMLELHKKAIFGTEHGVVTANKLPLTIIGPEEFQRLISEPKRYGYRCSVMAGAEAVDKVRDLRDLGDRPLEITGSFSGTLSYIATELEKGRRLSEIVSDAVAKKYTEPDPALDLSGIDVASKILILARTAGARLSMPDIRLSPFVPEGYVVRGDPSGLIRELRRADAEFASMMATARSKGRTLRYIARYTDGAHGPGITVGLTEVAKDDPFGQLKGNENKITVKTATYGDRYYSVEAPGAGVEITAQNIRRDLLYQIDNRTLSTGE